MTVDITHKLTTSMITSEHCDGEVRWTNGVLEQKWLTLEYDDAGHVTNRRDYWRKVPGNPNPPPPPPDDIDGVTRRGIG